MIQKGCVIVSNKSSEKQYINNLTTITHELQTPINLIAASAKLSGIKIDKNIGTTAELKKYMDNIIINCNKLSMLISNISENESDLIFLKEFVNTQQFAETFCSLAIPMCEEVGATLSFSLKTTKEYIKIPVFTVERILLNLITNGIKYNDKKDKKIKLKISNDRKNIIFSVKDNGIGISEENIPNITKRFYRVEKDMASGVGLGLYIVDRYLKKINGKMEVKSKINKGPEFIISIPFDSKEKFTASEGAYIYAPEVNSYKIEFAQLKEHREY